MTELELQAQVADYIRLQYPDVIFHSDFGSGVKLTMGQAVKQKRLNGGRRAWPDIFVAKAKVVYMRDVDAHVFTHGLFIELKKEGTKILKKDGSFVADKHIREQAKMLQALEREGYEAKFAVGFEQAKQIIDRYIDRVKGGVENVEF